MLILKSSEPNSSFSTQGCCLQQSLSAMPTKCLTGNLTSPAYSSLTRASQLCRGLALSPWVEVPKQSWKIVLHTVTNGRLQDGCLAVLMGYSWSYPGWFCAENLDSKNPQQKICSNNRSYSTTAYFDRNGCRTSPFVSPKLWCSFSVKDFCYQEQ